MVAYNCQRFFRDEFFVWGIFGDGHRDHVSEYRADCSKRENLEELA